MKPGLLVPVLAACATPTPQPAVPPATATPLPFIREHGRAFGQYAAYGGPNHGGHRRTSRNVSMPGWSAPGPGRDPARSAPRRGTHPGDPLRHALRALVRGRGSGTAGGLLRDARLRGGGRGRTRDGGLVRGLAAPMDTGVHRRHRRDGRMDRRAAVVERSRRRQGRLLRGDHRPARRGQRAVRGARGGAALHRDRRLRRHRLPGRHLPRVGHQHLDAAGARLDPGRNPGDGVRPASSARSTARTDATCASAPSPSTAARDPST